MGKEVEAECDGGRATEAGGGRQVEGGKVLGRDTHIMPA